MARTREIDLATYLGKAVISQMSAPTMPAISPRDYNASLRGEEKYLKETHMSLPRYGFGLNAKRSLSEDDPRSRSRKGLSHDREGSTRVMGGGGGRAEARPGQLCRTEPKVIGISRTRRGRGKQRGKELEKKGKSRTSCTVPGIHEVC